MRQKNKKVNSRFTKNALLSWGIYHFVTQTEVFAFHFQLLFATFHCILGCPKHKKDGIPTKSLSPSVRKSLPTPARSLVGKGSNDFVFFFLGEMWESFFFPPRPTCFWASPRGISVEFLWTPGPKGLMPTRVWHTKLSPRILPLSIPLCIKTLSTLGPHPHKGVAGFTLSYIHLTVFPIDLISSLFPGPFSLLWLSPVCLGIWFVLSYLSRQKLLPVAVRLILPCGLSLTLVTSIDIVEKLKWLYMNTMLYFYSSFRFFSKSFLLASDHCTLHATLWGNSLDLWRVDL